MRYNDGEEFFFSKTGYNTNKENCQKKGIVWDIAMWDIAKNVGEFRHGGF